MKLGTKFLSIPYVSWLMVFSIVPLLVTISFSFIDSAGNFTLENIFDILKYSSIFLYSLWLSFLSTLICLTLGYPISYIVSRISERYQNIILTFLILPMWINFLLRTYAWMTILENNGILNFILNKLGFQSFKFINTTGAVVFGMVYNFIPYMILPIYTSLTKIDKNIIESAQDLGANKFKIFAKVILPLSKPGIISGITMVFVPSVSTFAISKMLGGGTNVLIGELIELRFLGGSYNIGAGSSLAIFLMILIMLCISQLNSFNKVNQIKL